MAYQHDIFISYRRNSEVLKWIEENFLPLLKASVQFDLGNEPKVYIDRQLEAGGVWPLNLGEAIASSRIIIPLWTRTYLNSKWCALEISHMLERDRLSGFRTPENPYSLIIPVVIHDGETMPEDFSIVQKIEINTFFTLRMHKEGEAMERLSQALQAKAGHIASAIQRAPEWKNSWNIDTSNSFYQQFYAGEESSQSNLPKYTNP